MSAQQEQDSAAEAPYAERYCHPRFWIRMAEVLFWIICVLAAAGLVCSILLIFSIL